MAGVPHLQRSSNLTLEEPSPSENDESPSQFVTAPNRHRVEFQKAVPNSVTSGGGFNVSPSLTIHPLDYSALVTQENLHERELDHTLKGLVQWLAIVEAGFNSILDNAIEEEQDLSSDDSNDIQLYPQSKHDTVL